MKNKERLDEYLCKTFDLTKKVAQSFILQGYVYVNEQKITKTNFFIKPQDKIELRKNFSEYPSRSAYKLKDAILNLNLYDYIKDHICMDIGASHGGFTKVLMEYSAKKIYAIDVAKGIMDYRLRLEPKVILLEEKNIKDISVEDFAKEDFLYIPWFITCDVSFISILTVLKKLLSFIQEIQKIRAGFYFYGIFLLKPQFEDSKLTEKGIIKDPMIRKQIIEKRIKNILDLKYELLNHFPASIRGSKGNLEEILFLKSPLLE